MRFSRSRIKNDILFATVGDSLRAADVIIQMVSEFCMSAKDTIEVSRYRWSWSYFSSFSDWRGQSAIVRSGFRFMDLYLQRFSYCFASLLAGGAHFWEKACKQVWVWSISSENIRCIDLHIRVDIYGKKHLSYICLSWDSLAQLVAVLYQIFPPWPTIPCVVV